MTWVTLALAFVRKNWQAFAIAAAVLMAWAWHTSRVSAAAEAAGKAVHAHYATVLKKIADQTADAERKARATERAMSESIEGVAKNGQAKINLARTDARRADAAARSLRQQLAEYRRAATATATHPGAAPAGPPAGDAIDLLANLFSQSDDRSGELARFADLAHAAGAACEAAYDATHRALNDAQTR